jgi:acyl-CoA reductase-like NAD-dependent aldehyde dehydrogenase
MPVGDPLDPSTVIGPLVSAAQRNRVEGYIELGKSEGVKLALGGGRPKGLDRGYYVEPTVFSGVRNDMRIAREEIFGPVLVVIRYDNEEEAIAIANDSEYGLGGTVFTRDVEHGLDIARRVETGRIGVNFAGMAPNAPFGGVKSSGIGRESGPEGFEEYLTTKSIARQA